LSLSPTNKQKAAAAAGLGPYNQMHNYLYYNGNPNKPKIFSNLTNSAIKMDDETRKRV